MGLWVCRATKASGIVVGRYQLSEADGSVIDATDHFSGDNHLMSVGTSKNDVIPVLELVWPRHLRCRVGDAANEDLTSVFPHDKHQWRKCF